MSKLRLVIVAASALAIGSSAATAQGILRKTGQDDQGQIRNADGTYGTTNGRYGANAGVIYRGSRSRGSEQIPPGQMPPAGMCRVWIDGVAPGRQPRPTDCSTARATAPENSRVIYGGDANGRSTYDPRYDRNGTYDRNGSYDRAAEQRRIEERRRAEEERRLREERRLQEVRLQNERLQQRSQEQQRRDQAKWQQKRQKELEKSARKRDKDHDRDDDRRDDRGRKHDH